MKMNSLHQSRVLLFISSDFDFIKIGNYMMKEEMKAFYISEYSRETEISRGRSRFYQGLKDIPVYSGVPISLGNHFVGFSAFFFYFYVLSFSF
jgi:hypothetical protein